MLGVTFGVLRECLERLCLPFGELMKTFENPMVFVACGAFVDLGGALGILGGFYGRPWGARGSLGSP